MLVLFQIVTSLKGIISMIRAVQGNGIITYIGNLMKISSEHVYQLVLIVPAHRLMHINNITVSKYRDFDNICKFLSLNDLIIIRESTGYQLDDHHHELIQALYSNDSSCSNRAILNDENVSDVYFMTRMLNHPVCLMNSIVRM